MFFEDDDKPYLPSERKRERAREEGQFAYSHELSNGLMLYLGALMLWWSGTSLAQSFHHELRLQIEGMQVEMGIDEVQSLCVSLIGRGLQLTGAIMGLMFAAGLAANLGQAGLHINSSSLGPKWERLNPASNWSQLLSAAGIVRGGFALAKVGLIGFVAWWILSDRIREMVSLGYLTLAQSASLTWDISTQLMITSATVLLILGCADYGIQWFRHEKRLMMSHEEMKDDHKQNEGDPIIRAKRRQRAKELASQRQMVAEVPRATIVISNPTHYAVALRFIRGQMSAPVVIAKGHDQLALQIMAKARRHGIPVVQRKKVARALFKLTKVGQEIPQVLYFAVSEVMNYLEGLRRAA